LLNVFEQAAETLIAPRTTNNSLARVYVLAHCGYGGIS
jgi:hypothetical protein